LGGKRKDRSGRKTKDKVNAPTLAAQTTRVEDGGTRSKSKGKQNR